MEEQKTLKDKILSQNAGHLAVTRFLWQNNVEVFESIPFNNSRYVMLKTAIGKIMVVFKRDFFNSFGKIFASEGESGIGETINNEDLKSALREEIEWIYFIYGNAHIYRIKLIDFISNSHKRINDFEGKETRSINVKHLERIGEIY